MDIPGEVVCGGEDHDAGVVHPLARLPLPPHQLVQAALLPVKHNADGRLLDILRQLLHEVTHLNSKTMNYLHTSSSNKAPLPLI